MNENRKYTTIIAIPNMDDTTVKEARKLFLSYKAAGVIRSGDFDDDTWAVTDEYANYYFNFAFEDSDFNGLDDFLKVNAEDFILYLKTYVICQMGALALGTLQHIIHDAKATAKCSESEIQNYIISDLGVFSYRVGEFFSMIPEEGREAALDQMSEFFDNAYDEASYSSGAQRSLAAFESYFRFDEILRRFWSETQDESEKLFFFPVWLWWNISAVLPLRPREFVLTPRKCLSKTKEGYKLSVRRNNIKGSSKTKSYKINSDYRTNHYTIPDRIAKEILWYQQKTDVYMENDIHTLLIADTHYKQWGRCKPYTSRYYTYTNLKTCLRYFFQQIVSDRYGYTIIFDRDNSILNNDTEINYLHLGDTRHLALINLIMEGATPMVAMMLAGHDNPEMSAHYYSNIATLIECRTYREYKKVLNGQQTYKISGPVVPLSVKQYVSLPDGSRCYSENTLKKDFSDCYKVSGPSGELGFCENCNYHRSAGQAFNNSKDMYKNRILTECNNLKEVVKKVRSGRGEPEEITQILLKLKDDDYSYQQYLLETMEANHAEN